MHYIITYPLILMILVFYLSMVNNKNNMLQLLLWHVGPPYTKPKLMLTSIYQLLSHESHVTTYCVPDKLMYGLVLLLK